MKYFFSLVLVTITLFCYGQKNVLVQNINHRAKVLKHGLNATNDSLVLDSSSRIFKVEIFNDDYETSYNINQNSTKIPLNELPFGRFIIEAQLGDRLIIMTLVRRQDIKVATVNKPTSISLKKEALSKIEIKKYHTEAPISTPRDIPEKVIIASKDTKTYWVEYLISNGSSSYKTLRFANKNMADKMIAKNKLEMQSTHGKLNDLIIWEIYDTSEFLRFKRLNPDFAETEGADFFNVKPYYSSKDFIAGI